MSKPKPHDFHVQCKLRREAQLTYSWLPEKYAKVGKVIGLKGEDGEWEEGWVVDEVWGRRRSTDVLAMSDFYKTHRDGTDRYRNKDGVWATRKERTG
jgi:hypothetical protein